MKNIYTCLVAAIMLFAVQYAAAQTQTVKYFSKNGVKEVAPSEAHYVEIWEKNETGGGTRTRFLVEDSIKINMSAYSDLEGGNYGHGILDGPSSDWYENGNLKSVHHYKDNKLSGEAKGWYEGGALHYVRQYRDNMAQDTLKAYYEDGNLRRIEVYKNGNRTTGKLYDQAGKKMKFYPMMQMPQFPGGEKMLMYYLAGNIRYPESAVSANVEGIVFISFTVNKDGMISEAEVIKGIHPDADAEGLRVVNSMKKWKAGLEEGEPVAVRYTLPIRFSIR